MSEKTALVSRILNFSCVDGPGNRLVIFLQGCNFNCLSCHNPHTINHCNHCGDCVAICPAQALTFKHEKVSWDESLCIQCDKCTEVCTHKANPKIKRYSVTQMVEIIRRQRFFIAGITLSGGEATLQLPFMIELFKAIKADDELKGLTCFIDTNGELALAGWQRIAPFVDGVMLDLKSWQSCTHHALTGRDNQRVLESLAYLNQQDKLYELRLLHIPHKSDFEIHISELTALINALSDKVFIRLNAFQHHGVIGEALQWDQCSADEIERFASQLGPQIKQKLLLPRRYNAS